MFFNTVALKTSTRTLERILVWVQEAPELELEPRVVAERVSCCCRLKAVYDSLHDFGPRSVQQDPVFFWDSDLAMTGAGKWLGSGVVSMSSFLFVRIRTVNRC